MVTMYETRVELTNRKLLAPLKPQRVTGCCRSVTSRTTMPWMPRRDTRASWWPDGICDEHTTAVGGGGVGPPGAGLGNASGDALGVGDVAAAEGEVFAVLGLLPQATASRTRTMTRRFTPACILRPGTAVSAAGEEPEYDDPEKRAGWDHDAAIQGPVARPGFS